MKTTLELPDDLLIEAKQVAAKRRTTLKDLVVRSLRREIGMDRPTDLPFDSPFEIGALGLPVLKRTGAVLPAEAYRELIDAAEAKDDSRSVRFPRP